jgi:hypothetical protein
MAALPFLTLILGVMQYHVGDGCAPVSVQPAPDLAYDGGLYSDEYRVPPVNIDSGVDTEKLGDVSLSLDLPLRDYAPHIRPDLDLSEAEIHIDRLQVSPDGQLRSEKGLFSTRQSGCE